MKAKRIIGLVMKIPMYLLVIGAFGAGIYAAMNNIQGITYATPISIGVILGLYFVGAFLTRCEKTDRPKETKVKP